MPHQLVILTTALFSSVLGYAWQILHWQNLTHHDWQQFTEYRLVSQTALLVHNRLPVTNPWLCGHIPFLANPQTRVFSPNVVFDLLLNPILSNLVSLIFMGFLGILGGYRLLRFYGCLPSVAMAGGIAFVSSSWFGLHYDAGHIAFGSFQLLPWVVWLSLNLTHLRNVFFLGLLITGFLLDGGIYVFIFSILLIIPCVLKAWMPSQQKWQWSVFKRPWLYLSIVCCGLLASAKVLPVLLTIKGRAAQLENTWVSWKALGTIFLDPFQHLHKPFVNDSIFHFHEFGCYLGWTLLLVFVGTLLSSSEFRTKFRFEMGMLILFFWAGSGWFTPVNPWNVFQQIPFLNNAHVQSRLWLLMFLFFIILASVAVSQLIQKYKRHRWLWVLPLLMVLEAFFVKNYPATHSHGSRAAEVVLKNVPVTSNTLHTTTEHGQGPAGFHRNQGSRNCYEAAFHGTGLTSNNYEATHPEYRGEIYFAHGSGNVSLKKVLPGEISFWYQTEELSMIELNQNHLDGWKTKSSHVFLNPHQKRLSLFALPGDHFVKLIYDPWFIEFAVKAYKVGWGILLLLLFVFWRKTYPFIIPHTDKS